MEVVFVNFAIIFVYDVFIFVCDVFIFVFDVITLNQSAVKKSIFTDDEKLILFFSTPVKLLNYCVKIRKCDFQTYGKEANVFSVWGNIEVDILNQDCSSKLLV